MHHLLCLFCVVGIGFDVGVNALTHRPPVIMLANHVQKSYGSLLRDINSQLVDRLFVTEDLKTVYAEEDIVSTSEDGGIPGEQVSVHMYETSIHPILAMPLVQVATQNQVDTVILQEDWNRGVSGAGTLHNVAGYAGDIFSLGVFGTLFFMLVRSFWRRGEGNGGGGFQMPGMPTVSAGKFQVTKPNVSLSDWAGSPEVFRECTEVVSFLQNASIYAAAGAEIPKGVLLEGPPGTGKTLLAKGIAASTNASFVSLSASELVELFVGAGALKVRNLFAEARKNMPCIIFIDEIDAVGRQRGSSGPMGGNEEREQTLNQLLYEMDGFTTHEGIFVLAATNRRDILDAALLRPGRFDRIVSVPLPDRPSRQTIWGQYLSKKKVGLDDVFSAAVELAQQTAGFSGAQIKNVVNEAAILAARDGRVALTKDDLLRSLEKQAVGIVKEVDTRSETVLQRVAVHEMGHAFLALQFPETFDLKKVTIQATYGGAGGYTLFQGKSEDNDELMVRDSLQKQLVVAMGGKAAETVVFGADKVSAGAVQDLNQAYTLAYTMVTRYGMGSRLFSAGVGEVSDKTRAWIDKDVAHLMETALEDAMDKILQERSVFDALTSELQEATFLSGGGLRESYDDKMKNRGL